MRALLISSILAASPVATLSAVAHAQQAVILVRHAELQGAAMAEPKQLPLSEAGEARARRLAMMLRDSDVGAIYVTDYVRTNKTGEPLARELNKELTILPKGDPQQVVERLRQNHGGQVVLLIGHSDTLPGLIKAFGLPGDLKIEPQDYSNVFVVIPAREGAPTLLRPRY